MKFKKPFLFLIFIICISCNLNNNITPKSFTYEFSENSQIVINNDQGYEFISIEGGESLVFKYRYTADDDEEIADDEYSEILYFEIDKNLNNFSYSNDDLLNLQMYMQRFCFCPSIPIIQISIGNIFGTKQSNGNWNISLSINFEWGEQSETITREINGIFKPQ